MKLAIFKPPPPPLFGLDISSSAVKMVELEDAGKGAYRLERYAIEPLPKDVVADGNIVNLDAVSDAVERAWKKMATRAKHVAMALPTSAVITKKIVVPAGLSEEDLQAQVEGEANQYIPFALEEVNLDFQVVGPAPSGPEEVEVLIAASRKEKVEDRVAVAEAAGLKAAVMDVELYALQAACELVQARFAADTTDQNIALVDLGSVVTNVIMLRNGQAIYSREQAFGAAQLNQEIIQRYGLSPEEAETAKRRGDLPEGYEAEVLQPFLENTALEIQRAAQFFFTSTEYSSLEHIVLTGGGAALPGLQEVVSSRTRVETVIANPFSGMEYASRVPLKKLATDAPSLMVACGLALRRFDP